MRLLLVTTERDAHAPAVVPSSHEQQDDGDDERVQAQGLGHAGADEHGGPDVAAASGCRAMASVARPVR